MLDVAAIAHFRDLERLRDEPVWKLLSADTSPFICSSLLSLFPPSGPRQLGAAALHTKLDGIIDSLRPAGFEPSKPGQGYAADWVASGWLRRDFPHGAQEEHYTLTVAASSALRIVEGWRPNVSDSTGGIRLESRLTSVRSLMRNLDQLTDEDAQARLAALHSEKAALEQRIKDIEEGRLASIDEARAAEHAREIISQSEQLLADFDRVRDQFEVIHLDLRKRLLQHEGSRRELVEQILDGIDIIRETDAGRAFQAFWTLLLDSTEASVFEATARALAKRPFAARLSYDERLTLETIKPRLLTQASEVHSVRGRFVSGLHDYVRSKEYAEQRRILQLIGNAHRAATSLVGTIRPNEQLDLSFDRTSAAIRSLSQWVLNDPSASAAASQLEDHIPELASPDELRRMVLRAEVDMRTIKSNIQQYLDAFGLGSAADFLKTYPAPQGLGTVLGYMQLTVKHGEHDGQQELLEWTGMDHITRSAWAPKYVLSKEAFNAVKRS